MTTTPTDAPGDAAAVIERVLGGDSPRGTEFDACRAVVRGSPGSDAAFQALCMLLEGALADPRLDIDETRNVVAVLKGLARGDIRPEEVV